jgi:predicted nucleic acid-binding protein
MVVLDSSAVIPLITVGRIDLLQKNFPTVFVPAVVWKEVVEAGKNLGKNVHAFERGRDAWFVVHSSPDKKEVQTFMKALHLEEADAEVLLLAKQKNDILLTNDAALYACCMTENVVAWWLTTLLLASLKKKIISKQEAEAILLELVHTANIRLSSDILAQLLLMMRNM